MPVVVAHVQLTEKVEERAASFDSGEAVWHGVVDGHRLTVPGRSATAWGYGRGRSGWVKSGVNPGVLDTELYEAVPSDLRERWAVASRPGVRLLETPGSLVRLRDTGGAPVTSWQRTARDVLDAVGSYALATQSQSWWAEEVSGPAPVDLPATVLWGDADRSHRKAGTEHVLELLPQGRLVRVPAAGPFVDTEAVTTTVQQLRQLLPAAG